jgi:hypothetical protein
MKVPNTDDPAAKRRNSRRRVTDGTKVMVALLTYWMCFVSLNVDYRQFTAARHDLLAVTAGLLHGHAAPAMSLGAAGYRGPLA